MNRKLLLLSAILVIITISSVQYSYAQIDHVFTLGGLGNPEDVTTTSTHFFVTERTNNRIQIYDLNGTFVSRFGGSGSGNGQFDKPIGITTNNTHLFVVDSANHRIQIFYVNGTFVSQFGGMGSANGQFMTPHRIATNGTHLFVADTFNHRIQIFDTNGNFVTKFGSEGNGAGQFRGTYGVATNGTHIFASSLVNHKINIFDINGNYVSSFTSGFNWPRGITTTFAHIFVADTRNNKIQVFDFNLNRVSEFGGFNSPRGVTTNTTHLFVADSTNQRVQIFALSGIFIPPCPDGEIRDGAGTCIVDMELPVIRVTPQNITLRVGDTFTPPTVIITDNDPAYNGTVLNSTTPSDVDTSSVGVFTISYTAPADASNNVPITFTVTVNVIECNPNQILDPNTNACAIDTTKPVITVDRDSANRTITVEVGASYTVPAVNITDNDPDYSSTVRFTPSTIDTSSAGNFTITYSASADASGNTPLSVLITVNIVDTTKPVITVNGNSANHTVTTLIGESYTAPAGAITDNDQDYSETVTHNFTSIDTSRTGTFTIQYMASADAAGNLPLPVILTVNVACPADQIFDGVVCVTLIEHVLSFGSVGSSNSEFMHPHGISTNDTHLFIADFSNHRVQVYDINGNYAYTIGGSGNASGQFRNLVGLTTNSTHIFVADYNNHRIQIFDNSGNYAGQFGVFGTGDGQFRNPHRIITNGTHLFVADTSNHRIQIFDNSGNYAGQFGVFGTGNGQFKQPNGIAVNDAHLFVVDRDNHRIQIFDHAGNYTGQFGGTGTGNGQFRTPQAITLSDSYILVTEGGTHRVQIFDHDGNYVGKIGGTSLGSGNGQFNNPQGITTNDTHVFVGDTHNHRIQIFQIASLIVCLDGQIRDTTDTCVIDNILPVITVDGNNTNRTVSIAAVEPYTVPAGTVTDNDIFYSGTVRSNTTSIDTSSAGTFAIQYTASADDSGNAPLPVVLTVNVIECPVNQSFNGIACAIPEFNHVLSFGSEGNGTGQFADPIGITTNDTHIFMADFSNDRVQIFDHMGNYVSQFGSSGTGDGELDGPIRITTNDTHIFVVENINHRVQIFDNNGQYVAKFGRDSGSGSNPADGRFRQPQGITTNDTHLFVADTNNNRIQIWDIDGNYVGKFGSQGAGPGQFNSPFGITTNDTHLYVADSGRNRVQIFDINGNFVKQFGGGNTGTAGAGNGQFNSPRAITTTVDHLYVADGNNHRVQVFDNAGNYLTQFGSAGNGTGQFNTPRGITTNNTHIFVVDSNNDRAQIFEIPFIFVPKSCIDLPVSDRTSCIPDTTKPIITVSNDTRAFLVGATYNEPSANVTDNDPVYSGTISTTPSSINTTSPGTFNVTYTASADVAGNTPVPVVITVNVSCPVDQFFDGTICVIIPVEHVLTFGSAGSGNGQFDRPRGIITTGTNIFVTDIGRDSVQIFDSDGNYISQFGSRGTADGQFNNPQGITTNSTHLYIVSSGDKRVHIFDINGTFVSKFGGANGEFSNPEGITTNGTHLYVADTFNHRVQIFDINGTFVKSFGSYSGIGSTPPDGQFDQPQGIATNGTHLFVADTSNGRVQIFDVTGNYVSQFGNDDSGIGELTRPRGITIHNSYIFVADTTNHKIQIFDINGNYISQFGGFSGTTINPPSGQFNTPQSLTTNATHVFVADTSNQRIQIFALSSIFTLEPCADGEIRDSTDTCIMDTEPPTISVNPQTITLQVGDTFIPPTVTISDNDPAYAGTVTATPSTIGTSSAGTFTISYSAPDDASGNSPIPVVLTVTVIAASDTTPPTIELTGANPQIITVGTAYAELGATCSDETDDAITPTIDTSSVDTSTAGNYTVTYDCADAAGNDATQLTRTVNVVTPPDTAPQSFEHVLTFGEFRSDAADGSLNAPHGIAINDTHIFVADTNRHRIQIFDNMGNYVSKIGGPSAGSGNGQFNEPQGITTSAAHIFVSDKFNHRIQIFDHSGNFVNQIGGNGSGSGGRGSGNGELTSPTYIVTNSTHLYIVDTGNNRIQIFDNNGTFVSNFGTAFAFLSPEGIDTNGTHIFVVDTNNNQIHILDLDGNTVREFGDMGTGNGNFSGPRGIAVSDTHIFVADRGNNRIQIFDINGTYVNQFGEFGTDAGEFKSPVGIATNNTHLLVTEANGHRVQVFALSSSLLPESCPDDQIRNTTGTCIMDTDPPTITVTPTTITLQVGQTFTPTITISDNDPAYAGSVTANTTINTDNPGTFVIQYDAPDDASGNMPVPVLLTIIVEAAGTPDTTPPRIEVNPLITTLEIGDTFTPPTVTVSDNVQGYFGIISNTTTPSGANASSVGNFTITYNATADAAGNAPIPVNATVNVIDTTAPEITVNGSSTNRTVTLIVDDPYTVLAGNVTDNDPAYSETVAVNTTSIDTSSAGTFAISYTASADDSGNSPLPVILTVNVTAAPPDTTLPVIEVDGSSANRTVTLAVGATYTVPAGVVTDTDPAYNETVTATPSTISTASPGRFTITYDAPADDAGNEPLLVVLTVIISCPAEQLFNGNACVAILEHVLSFGSSGSGNSEFMHPHGVATNGTHLFIADFSNHRVQVFDIDGNYAYTIGDSGDGNADGQFSGLVGLSTNGTRLFVADFYNHRIQIFDTNGTYLSKFGGTSSGTADGQFNNPRGIVTNGTHFFVADTNNHRIQIFDINGTFVAKFGGPSASATNGQFNTPNGIAINGTHLFVVDSNNNRIQILDTNGNYISKFGSSGTGNGQLGTAFAITVTDSYILVTEGGTNRVQIFDHDGNYVSKVGGTSSGTADGQFDRPQGITTNDTHVFVGDTHNHRIQIFQIASLMSCPDANQVRDTTNTCVDDTILPEITVGGNSSNRTVTVTAGEPYTVLAGVVTDNDASYSETVRSNTTSIDTSSAGTFAILYTADADASGNEPLPVVLTVNVTAAPQDTTPPEISVNPTSITLEIGDTFTPPTVTVSDNVDGYAGIISNTTTPSGANASSVGVFTITYNATADAAGNAPIPVNVTVTVTDTTAPTIMASYTNITLQIDATFTPPTVNVTDNDPAYSGIISNSTTPSDVDTGSAGNFTITYSASADASGNTPVPVEVTVNVVAESDTTSPTFALEGANPQTITVGTEYTELGATCSDETDGAITPTIVASSVDTSTAGNYTVTYDCADVAGNDATQLTRTVNVVAASDTTAPTFALEGANPQTITVGTEYTELGATCSDETDGAITPTIVASSVDTSTAGNYTVTYDCADVAGNDATQLTRTVNVVAAPDTTRPVITVDGSNANRTVSVTVGEPYQVPTGDVSDIVPPGYTGSVTSNTTSINTTNVGTFIIQYTADADTAGNIPLPVLITVNVEAADTPDTTPPRIEVSLTDITLEIGDTFTPPTVSVTDNVPGYSGTISNSTSPSIVDTSNIGVFTITYNATADAAGNAPIPVNVTVNVTDTTAPRIAVTSTNITLQIDDPFTPPIVTLSDNDRSYSGTISNSTTPSNVDTSNIGVFTITYEAPADASGNEPIPVMVTVNVVDNDPPTIIVTPQTITLQIGESFAPPTITLTDNDPAYSGTISNTTSPSDVDTSSAGSFTITYEAPADASNNGPVTVTVTVNVIDTTLPTIEATSASITLEIGQTFTPPTVTVMDNDQAYVGTITNSTSPSDVDTSSAGVFTITYMASADAAGNEPTPIEVIVTVTPCSADQIIDPVTSTCVVDTERPVIEVTTTIIPLQVGDPFTPPTVTLSDNDRAYSGTLTNSTSPSDVDTSSIGVFTITYNATADAAGNAPIPVNVTVNVTDTTLPTIEGVPASITLEIGQTFTPPAVTVMDNDPDYVGIISNTTSPGPVDTNSAGSFTITYMASADAAGNEPVPVEVIVTVTACAAGQVIGTATSTCIVDTTPPRITASYTSIELEIDDPFTPPIVTLSDNDRAYSGTLTNSTTPSAVDTSSAGVFTITYEAPADASNNGPVTVTVTVEIVDNDAPTITVTSTTITLQMGQPFTLPSATISDNDRAYSGTVTATPSTINTASPGTFTIQYTGTADASGNEPTPVTVTVIVTPCETNEIIDPVTNTCIVDDEPPVITVSSNHIILLTDTTYIEPIVTVSDNNPSYFESITSAPTPGPVDTSSAGNYTITYTALDDAAGNSPLPVEVIIEVVAQCPRDTVEDHFRTCIIDTSPPIITVPGSLYVTVLVGANYTLPNATVSDNALVYNEIVTSTGSVDTSSLGNYTITYDGLPDASLNQPISIVLTVTVATECPTGQMPNDDDVCFVPRTSGGSSSDWKTKPTFGLSWENNQPFISNGFTLNDHTLDITNNWHTSFVPVNGVIGKENNAKIKVYAPKGLNTVMLSLGVPEVGKINDAETNIIVSILPNYTGTISYIITEITHEQKESLVDETQTTATLSKSLCNDSDIIEKCYTVDINFVVLAPLKSDPLAITAIDTKHRYTTTYINEGLTFTGNSMLEPATAQLVVKKGNQYDAETIDLIQQDRRHNLWEDQYGNLWTQNDHETWIQLTFPENTPNDSYDSYVNVMTRMHTAFDSRVDVHTQNMESIRDSMYRNVYTDTDDDQ